MKGKLLKNTFILVSSTAILSIALFSVLQIKNPLSEIGLPMPGAKLVKSESYVPVHLKGLRMYPEDANRIDFFVDTGNSGLEGKKLENEVDKLVRYFLASLTVPAEQLWVNLSPYEKDKMVPEKLAATDMGSELLAQDYLLKQLTASLSDPETDLGKEYWTKLRSALYEAFGTTQTPLDTFNKVWIVPQMARVHEHDNVAVVSESSLKALMETDYMALSKSDNKNSKDTAQSISTSVMKEIILPVIEDEINNGKNFAQLRQMYSAMILSTWFKKSVAGNKLHASYVDRNKVSGIESNDQELPSKIYAQYVDAFEKGVYKYVRAENDLHANQKILRRYVSGGFEGAEISSALENELSSKAFIGELLDKNVGEGIIAPVNLKELKAASAIEDYNQYVKSGKKVPLDESLIGLKSKNQVIAKNILVLPVPEFAIVTTDFMRDTEDLDDIDWLALAEAILQDPEIQAIPVGKTLAIRPAGVINMPGLATTVKGVKKDAKELAKVLSEIAKDWQKQSIVSYRGINDVANNSMFAFMIQREISGDLNENSGSGVFYTRHPETGENKISGNFCINAPGEYVRNGEGDKAYHDVGSEMYSAFPEVYKKFEEYKLILEKHFKYPQEVEFVIEDGELFIVQTVDSDLSQAIESDVLMEMNSEGLVSLQAVTAKLNDMVLKSIYEFKSDSGLDVVNIHAEVLSEGAMLGRVCFTHDQARALRADNKRAIVFSPTINDELEQAIIDEEIDGVILGQGNYSMHAARILREQVIPAIVMNDVEVLNKAIVVDAYDGQEVMFNEGDPIAFNESTIYVPHNADDEDLLQLKEEIAKKKLELERLEKIKDDVFDYLITNEHDYQKAVFLHALMYANVNYLQTVEHDRDRAIGLEAITTSVHKVARVLGQQENNDKDYVNFEIAELESDLSAVIKINPAFVLSEEDYARITSPKDFLAGVNKKADDLIERYNSLKISQLDYANYKLGFNDYASKDNNLYIEFSLMFENPMIFSGESVKLIKFLNQMKFYAHYKAAYTNNEWSTEDKGEFPDIELNNVNIAADPADPAKMRIQANIAFPEHADRVVFTLRSKDINNEVWLEIKDAQGIIINWKKLMTKEERFKHILDTNKVEPSGSTKPLVKVFDDKLKLQNTIADLIHKNTQRSYLRLLTRSLRGSGYYDGDTFVADENYEFTESLFVGQEKERFVWEIDDQQYKLREYGRTRDKGPFDKTQEIETSEELTDHIKALSVMINFICGKQVSVIREIDTFRSDSIDWHTTTYDQYYRTRWLSMEREAMDLLVSGLYDLQDDYAVEHFLKLDEDGNINDVELEPLIVTLYNKKLETSSSIEQHTKGGFDFSSDFLDVESNGKNIPYTPSGGVKVSSVDLLGIEPELMGIAFLDTKSIFDEKN